MKSIRLDIACLLHKTASKTSLKIWDYIWIKIKKDNKANNKITSTINRILSKQPIINI